MASKVPLPTQGPRPSFIGLTPLTPLAMETTQRFLHMQNHQSQSKPSCLKLLCFVLLVITGFNTLFTTMIMYKNSALIQENRELIGQLFQREMKSLIISGTVQLQPPNSQFEDTETFSNVYKLSKMIDIGPRADCPPCTTPKPTPVEPHKNPVSILNEEIGNGKAILYECVHTCIGPPIHFSYLTINNTEFQGKQWTGQGMSKSTVKQAAAYLAIQEIFPHLESSIGAEHIPDMDYHPRCNTPNPEGHVGHEGGKKC